MLEEERYELEVQVDGQAVQQMAEPFPALLFPALWQGWAHDLPTAQEPGSQAPTFRLSSSPSIKIRNAWPGRPVPMVFS